MPDSWHLEGTKTSHRTSGACVAGTSASTAARHTASVTRTSSSARFAMRQGNPVALGVERLGRGEDSIASRKLRMPYLAKIKRDDPFRPEDEREIEAMCKRIAAAGEYMALAGWRDDAGFRVFHFGTWTKARHAALDRPQRHCSSASNDSRC